MYSAWEILAEKFDIPKYHKDQMKGGLADNKKPSDFNQKELRMGIKTEMEHTNSVWKAMEIAMDHLLEDPNYYTHLASMEKKYQERGDKNQET